MKSKVIILFMIVALFSCGEKQKSRVLVFSKTSGYRHESIGTGKLAIMDLGKKNNFDVDTTEDASTFNENNLKRYSAVVFLNTTMDVLDVSQQADFQRFIQAGGGYAGVHAAADTEYDWPWYGQLAGAYFKSHPKIQEAKFKKAKPSELTKNLPDEWIRTDELYNYKNISDKINVLYTLDESSYKGGENGDYHPIAWYHEFDGGRAFYTGMGHTKECYADSLFLDHLLKGIQYAIGEHKMDYSKATAKRAPEENRFTKVVLGNDFDEPTEMAILPDSRILFLERKGDVKLYDPKDDSIRVINKFKVWTKFEDGMLGLTTDPGFASNKWLYIYYSLPNRSVNVLSRFVFDGNKIDTATEKILLEVPVQRETCCHTGGSLAFGPGENLFLSTGDNSSPFESEGFSPSDERVGRSPFDAQKSSSNTNDLRGKILRIHPEKGGTYSIPDGNLFAKGEEKTRPEIYIMGDRNPYRIAIDQKTGFLYWGEVGPDAGKNDSLRGPRGYDELNQARKPGFFGWPYFVGKNYAYHKYDFGKRKVSEEFNPEKPVNTSPNNTGKKELPAVSPPFIWYPYAKSEEFPLVKEGGRNAMAGPIYYSENFKGISTAYPDYLDGKPIIYDWMRNWMMLVNMDDQGNYISMEPFLPNMKFNNIIDMAFGPDGRLYTLEYGTAWFKRNADARLSRIDYNSGNRVPQALLKVDKESGSIPLSVNFSARGTKDPDGDEMTYSLEWPGQKLSSKDGEFNVTFDKPGVYKPKLIVTDDEGATASTEVTIVAGNSAPKISISTDGNTMFFFPTTPINYTIRVEDKEDGEISDAQVNFDYLAQGYDMTKIAQGHQRPELAGKALMASSDCKACHMIDQKSAGPAYRDVAKKYKGDAKAVEKLTKKVLEGGSGVWGTTEMSAHPQLAPEDVSQMVEYILSLSDESTEKLLPLTGSVTTGNGKEGAYIFTASYKDKGAQGAIPLSSSALLVLRSASISVSDVSSVTVARKLNAGGRTVLENVKNNATATFKNIDLTNVGKLELVAATMGTMANGEVEVYIDGLKGTLIGETVFAKAPKIKIQDGIFMSMSKVSINTPVTGKHDIYLIFKNAKAGDKDLFYFSQINLEKR